MGCPYCPPTTSGIFWTVLRCLVSASMFGGSVTFGGRCSLSNYQNDRKSDV
jgi:hypothetical protein